MTVLVEDLEPHVVFDAGRPSFVHMCNGDLSDEPLPLSDATWRADESTDTVEPSIECEACGAHGHWIRGSWMPAD